MTNRELINDIFFNSNKKHHKTIYQPRIEYWFERNQELGKLPDQYKDLKTWKEFYKFLDLPTRPYFDYQDCWEINIDPKVKLEAFQEIGSKLIPITDPGIVKELICQVCHFLFHL